MLQGGPPKPPRTAFMCVADHKVLELKITKKEVLQIASALWRDIRHEDRAYWDEVAREDKVQ